MNWKPIINTGIALVIILLLLAWYGEHKRAVLAERNLEAADGKLVTQNALKDSILLYTKDSLTGKLYESNLRMVSERNAKELLKDSINDITKRYKKLMAVMKIGIGWKDIDTVFTTYTDTVYAAGPCDSLGYMKVPRMFDYSSDGLTFGAKVERTGVSIFNKHLSLGQLTIVAGWKRTGLWGLGKGAPVLDVATNNPDVYVTSVKNAFVKQQPRAWYDSRGAWMVYGKVADVLIRTAINLAAGKPVGW
jgi:hypothetical protein